jgi:hypothetical protein
MGNYMVPNNGALNTSVDAGDGSYDEANTSFHAAAKMDSRGGKRNTHGANNTVDGVKATGRFRSIQAKGQTNNMIQNLNINLVNQNSGYNPNNSIDIGQLPMRLVSQKAGQRKNGSRDHANGSIMNTMMPGTHHPGNSKNAWQSIDASSIGGGGHEGMNKAGMNQGLMIQPCSNQAQNIISNQGGKLEISRPSVTQSGANPGTAGAGRSPRGNNAKNQFYAVHGRGMNIQNNTGYNVSVDSHGGANTKGILTKIFRNTHTRQMQQQNYVDHMNQTHGNFQFNAR